MKCVVESDNVAALVGPFPVDFIKVIAKLSGAKTWLSSATVEICPTYHNLELLKEWHVEIERKPRSHCIVDAKFTEATGEEWTYRPKVLLRHFQNECLMRSWDKRAFAVFAEMGLGKTAIEIANIGMLYATGRITGAIIFAPNGVHAQWIEDEFPKHADPRFEYMAHIWNGNPIKSKFGTANGCEILAMNIDAIRLKRVKRKIVHISEGLKVARDFIDAHGGRVICIIDESHDIKNYASQRTKAAWSLAKEVDYRRILTGTPIARNLVDAWSQFQFLDPNILGYRNMVAFRAHFCIMGGYEGKQVVGVQNVEEFYSIIAPFTYRKTKAEVTDLPPKAYCVRKYEMSADTRRHYVNMKKRWLTRFDSGEIKDAKNGLAALLRLQQILCGFLENEAGEIEEIGSGERIDAMMDIIEQTEGHTIIWARFTHDIRKIAAALREKYGEDCCVTYDGTTNDEERKEAKRKFSNRECRFFIGNVAISAGLDGLQVAGTMIFYSNDFNAIHRWQSEDRAHRFGMVGLTIFDLIARGSIDNAFLRNLSNKKSLSDLTLDQIRQAIVEN